MARVGEEEFRLLVYSPIMLCRLCLRLIVHFGLTVPLSRLCWFESRGVFETLTARSILQEQVLVPRSVSAVVEYCVGRG